MHKYSSTEIAANDPILIEVLNQMAINDTSNEKLRRVSLDPPLAIAVMDDNRGTASTSPTEGTTANALYYAKNTVAGVTWNVDNVINTPLSVEINIERAGIYRFYVVASMASSLGQCVPALQIVDKDSDTVQEIANFITSGEVGFSETDHSYTPTVLWVDRWLYGGKTYTFTITTGLYGTTDDYAYVNAYKTPPYISYFWVQGFNGTGRAIEIPYFSNPFLDFPDISIDSPDFDFDTNFEFPGFDFPDFDFDVPDFGGLDPGSDLVLPFDPAFVEPLELAYSVYPDSDLSVPPGGGIYSAGYGGGVTFGGDPGPPDYGGTTDYWTAAESFVMTTDSMSIIHSIDADDPALLDAHGPGSDFPFEPNKIGYLTGYGYQPLLFPNPYAEYEATVSNWDKFAIQSGTPLPDSGFYYPILWASIGFRNPVTHAIIEFRVYYNPFTFHKNGLLGPYTYGCILNTNDRSGSAKKFYLNGSSSSNRQWRQTSTFSGGEIFNDSYAYTLSSFPTTPFPMKMVYNGLTIDLYLDGVLLGSFADTDFSSGSSILSNFGGFGTYFTGAIHPFVACLHSFVIEDVWDVPESYSLSAAGGDIEFTDFSVTPL